MLAAIVFQNATLKGKYGKMVVGTNEIRRFSIFLNATIAVKWHEVKKKRHDITRVPITKHAAPTHQTQLVESENELVKSMKVYKIYLDATLNLLNKYFERQLLKI